MDELLNLLNIEKKDAHKYKVRYLKKSKDGNEPYDLIASDKEGLLDWLAWKFGKTDILGNCEKVIGLVRNYQKSKDSWIYIGTYFVEKKNNFDNIENAPAYNLTQINDDYSYKLEIEYELPNNQTSVEILSNIISDEEKKMKINNNYEIEKKSEKQYDYSWIPIFEELAEKLLEYKHNREKLVDLFYEVLEKEGKLGVSDDRNCNMLSDLNGNKIKFHDIDPFTFMNRLAMYSESNNIFRTNFLKFMKEKMNLKSEIPTGFDGIPSVNYLSSWFFPHIYNQKGDEISNLWNLFEVALAYSKSNNYEKEFINAFNKINPGVAITCALFRAKPSFYVSLDANSVDKLTKEYDFVTLKDKLNGEEYINYMHQIKDIIKNNNYKNNADFSYKAWLKYGKKEKNKNKKNNGNDNNVEKTNDSITKGQNIIYYGVPGCGKSYKVNKISKDYDYVVRTVFHPDYTYTDFIGQVMPIIVRKDRILYDFIPGPFTDALRAAKENTNKKVLLIIEEINRGNAAAIFGDIFQLLDRDDNSYKVQNESICSYLRKNTNNKFKEHEFDLPNNLDIIATMNTSDQNVYPLDTAFRRRFSFVRVKNDFDDIDPEDKEKVQELKEKKIAGLNISWENFFSIINKYIISNSNLLLNNEDKRLGAFSVNVNDLSDKRKFADKVLFYLWDNIGKYNPDIFFRESYTDKEGDTVYYKVYDQIIDKYIDESSTDIFCEDLKNLLDEKIEEKKEQENEK